MNKTIYPIFYINLSKSNERKTFMENQFLRFNINNYKRIDAINGNNIKLSYRYKFTKPITYNEIGCTLSHFEAIKQAYNDNCEIAIICEDDINFSFLPRWKETFKEIEKNAPNNWYIIKLHDNNYINIPTKNVDVNYNLFTTRMTSTGLYMINRNSMKFLLDRYFINNSYYLRGKFGQADKILYNPKKGICAHSYNIPLVYDNINFKSQIKPSHEKFQLRAVSKIIKFYDNFRKDII